MAKGSVELAKELWVMVLLRASGRDACWFGAGTCVCFTGYVGPACQSCGYPFVNIGAVCVFLPDAMATCSDGVRTALCSQVQVMAAVDGTRGRPAAHEDGNRVEWHQPCPPPCTNAA